MRPPFKQLVRFPFATGNAESEANAWLSARENEKYYTEIIVTAGRDWAGITIVYWKN